MVQARIGFVHILSTTMERQSPGDAVGDFQKAKLVAHIHVTKKMCHNKPVGPVLISHLC